MPVGAQPLSLLGHEAAEHLETVSKHQRANSGKANALRLVIGTQILSFPLALSCGSAGAPWEAAQAAGAPPASPALHRPFSVPVPPTDSCWPSLCPAHVRRQLENSVSPLQAP